MSKDIRRSHAPEPVFCRCRRQPDRGAGFAHIPGRSYWEDGLRTCWTYGITPSTHSGIVVFADTKSAQWEAQAQSHANSPKETSTKQEKSSRPSLPPKSKRSLSSRAKESLIRVSLIRSPSLKPKTPYSTQQQKRISGPGIENLNSHRLHNPRPTKNPPFRLHRLPPRHNWPSHVLPLPHQALHRHHRLHRRLGSALWLIGQDGV